MRRFRSGSQALLRVVADLGSGDLRLTGTLGVLLKAKESGTIPLLKPVLDKLQALRFWVDPGTREAVLKLAGEL